MAYDALTKQNPQRADKEYLKVLKIASGEGEGLTQAAIVELLAEEKTFSAQALEEIIQSGARVRPVTDVTVEELELKAYDELLRSPEEELAHA